MTYYDYMLKAEDQEDMGQALIDVGVVAQLEPAEITLLADGGYEVDSDGYYPVEGVDISVIGVWTENTGTEEDPIMTPVEGYHVNVRSTFEIEWPGTVELMYPVTPWRIWG